MNLIIILTMAALAGGSGGEGISMEQDRFVQSAIEAFQPARMPEPGQLRRMVVVIDPVWDKAQDRWETNHLSLLTAEHLFHLVQRSGGVPVMTRADDLPSPTDSNEDFQRLCARARCHVVVRIRFGSKAGEAGGELKVNAVTQNDHPLSVELAKAMGGGQAGNAPSGPRVPAGIPAVLVEFPSPPASGEVDARRQYHRGCGAAIHRGIAALWEEKRSALDEARRHCCPDADTATSQPVPLYGNQSRESKLHRASRQIWPEGNLPVEKAAWFCEAYRKQALSDRTIVYFEPQVVVTGTTVELRGATTMPSLIEGLLSALRTAGMDEVRNAMRILPEDSAAGSDRFGACATPMARTFVRPSDASGVQTQLLYGEPVLILDRQEDFLLVQAGDGYWGWVRQTSIRPMSSEAFRRYTAPPHAVLLRDIQQNDGWLRSGTRLPVESRSREALTLRRPDGQTLTCRAADVHFVDERAAMERRIRSALNMLYTPYVFGARSSVGLDCSGLVGNLLEQEGTPVARDAAQQFLAGKLVATRWQREGLRAGDRIYFIDSSGKIFHTAIALSSTHYIHASPPEVQISSLRKGDRLYNAHYDETFLGAKRP